MRHAALTALVLAGAAAAGVLLLGRSGGQRPIGAARPLTVRAFFAPQTVQFGDELTARVVVLVDRAAVRVGSLRINDGFAPLAQLGAARTTRTQRGRLAVVSVSVAAACLADACAAAAGEKPITLPPVTVQARTSRGGTVRGTARWPSLHVTSRLAAADLAAANPPFRGETLPPSPAYRIAPGTLALVLDVVAALLAASGVGLAAWNGFALLRRGRTPVDVDELELALRRMREAEVRPAPDRRRALGLLARLLDRRGGRFAGAASELAWSKPTPEPKELSALATRIERTGSE
jgi:hypothetical protein